MTNETVFEGRFDDSDILKALRRIEDKLEDVEKKGDDAFKRTGNGAGGAAAKIGIIGGAVAGVVTKLLELGQAGVEALRQITQESVQTARAFESVGASLEGIFQGNEQLAGDTFEFIRAESRRLGLDLTNIASAFLPQVGSLDEFTAIAEVAAGLAGRNAQEGAEGAQFALREAFSGDFLSLQDRFNISRSDIASIKELQGELGNVEGLLTGLNQILERDGQSFEQFADTSQTALNRVNEFITDLKGSFGEGIVGGQGEAFNNLLDLLEENQDQIQLIAGAIGDVIGLAIELSSIRILEGVEDIDAEPIASLTGDIGEFLFTLRVLSEQLGALSAKTDPLINFFGALSGSVGTLNDNADESSGRLQTLNEYLQDAARGAAFLRAVISGAGAALGAFAGGIDDLLTRSISFEEFGAQIAEASQTAFDDVIQTAGERINTAATIDVEVEQRAADRQAEAADTDTDGINQFLAQNTAQQEEATAADEEAAKAKEELAKAQEKVNDAQDKFATDQARKQLEEQIRLERKQIDLAIELAQKREDAAKKNAASIADIFRKNQQSLADLQRSSTQERQDIEISGFRQLENAERQSAQRRQDIETDYRRELERIRDRFSASAQEAIRANDAIAFLQAQRTRDQELREAERGRQEETQDATAEASRRRDEINRQLEQEIADAQIANQRKLQDLQISLQRELQEQRISYERELQELALNEERKRQAQQRAAERRRQDQLRQAQQRLADLQRTLEKELELIKKADEKKEQLAKRRQEIRAKNRVSDESRSGTNNSEDEDETETKGTGGVRAELRHSGGPVAAGRPYTVRPDEEVVNFPQSGQVIPINRLIQGGISAGAGGSSTQNVNFTAEIMRGLPPDAVQKIERYVIRVLQESFNV